MCAPQRISSPKHIELRHDVEYLFSLAGSVCPEHTTSYFPADLQHFLATSTSSQLRAYLHNYGPAIKLSIQEATRRSTLKTRPIWTFAGFTRGRTTTNPPLEPSTHSENGETFNAPPTPPAAAAHAPSPTLLFARRLRQSISKRIRRPTIRSPVPPPQVHTIRSPTAELPRVPEFL